MRIYVIRHGQTDLNKQDRVCGIMNPSLNKEGIKQAQNIAQSLQNSGINKIISSPLKRAVETASEISKKIDLKFEMEERLIEQNCGIYEGVSRMNPQYILAKKMFGYRYPEGESTFQVVSRIYNFLDECREKYTDRDYVLLVTHGGVSRIIHTYFNDMTNEQFYDFQLFNCNYMCYIYN